MVISRRQCVVMAAAWVLAPGTARALTEQSATALVDEVVAELNRIINSGESEKRMMIDFKQMFTNYGHVGVIARYVLGPDARGLSKAKFAEYQDAFEGYMSRKYGRRFRMFIGAKVKITGASKKKRFVEVFTVANLKDVDPFEVNYMVSEYRGRERFHDIVLKGVSLLSLEKSEVRAILDKNHGNIDKLIAVLDRL